MKKSILSVIACLSCAVFLLSPINACAVAPVLEELIADTIYSEFLGYATDEIIDAATGDETYIGITGVEQKLLQKVWEKALSTATTNNNGDIQITVPRYDLITGKYQLKWSTYDLDGNVTKTDNALVECTMILADSWSMEHYDQATKTTYYSNGLNYTITRSNGSVRKYFVSFPASFNYNNSVSFSQNSIAISAQNGCTLYDVSGGQINQVIENGFYCAATRFTQNTVNSIDCDINQIMTGKQTNNQYSTDISAFYSSFGNTISSSSNTLYPVDKDIMHGSFLCKYPKLDGSNSSVGVAYTASQYLWTGFVATNNTAHKTVINNYYTTNNTQNYYTDPLDGGTVINKNNYEEKNLPQLAPVFDLDTSLPDWDMDLLDLIPDLLAALGDLFDGNILDMIGRLLDFFGNMPDINANWSPDTTLNNNNYFDIELPALPDSGGGGSGGDITVNVDITRPKIPEVTTEPNISFDLPDITTITYPSGALEAAEEVIDIGKSCTDALGMTQIILGLGAIGVAVMLIFKDW